MVRTFTDAPRQLRPFLFARKQLVAACALAERELFIIQLRGGLSGKKPKSFGGQALALLIANRFARCGLTISKNDLP